MNELFDLAMPWWQFALRGALAYLGLLILLRLAGKRAFGEMSPFDIVVLILVGGTLRSAIVGKDTSLMGPFIAITTIVALDKLMALTATRSALFNRILQGVPLLLAESGRLRADALRAATIPRADFDRELRLHEIRSIDEVDSARLEANGRVSVLRRKQGVDA